MNEGTFSFRRCALSGDIFVEGTTCRASFEYQQRPVNNTNALLSAVWTGKYHEDNGTCYFTTFTSLQIRNDAIWSTFQGSKVGDAMAINVVQAFRRYSERKATAKPEIVEQYEKKNWFIKKEHSQQITAAYEQFGPTIFNWTEEEFRRIVNMSTFELACTTLPHDAMSPSPCFLTDKRQQRVASFIQNNLTGRAISHNYVTMFPEEMDLLKPHIICHEHFLMTKFDAEVMHRFVGLLPLGACRPPSLDSEERLEDYLLKLCEFSTFKQFVVFIDTANPERASVIAKQFGFRTCLNLFDICNKFPCGINLPLIILRNRFLAPKGRGPLYAAEADFVDIEFPFFDRLNTDTHGQFYQFVTSRSNAKETIKELIELNLIPVRRGTCIPLSFYEHLKLDTPRYVQGAIVRIKKNGEIALIKKVLKKSNGDITRILLDDEVTYTLDDVTILSQVTSRSNFRRKDGRATRYGTIIAFFPYSQCKAYVRDKMPHEDVCKVLQLIYSGLASKIIFVAMNWNLLDIVLKHDIHTAPPAEIPGTTFDTILSL